MTNDSTRFRLVVPTLRDRPSFGGGCCARPAADVLTDALLGVTGIRRVSLTGSEDALVVTIDIPEQPVLTQANQVLAAYGYPVTDVRPFRDSPA